MWIWIVNLEQNHTETQRGKKQNLNANLQQKEYQTEVTDSVEIQKSHLILQKLKDNKEKREAATFVIIFLNGCTPHPDKQSKEHE